MSRSTPGTQPRRSLAACAALVACAALLTGCAETTTSREGVNVDRGQELFQQKCGACHVLADAGTAGELGPNLDDAFGFSRQHGFDESTFFEVTLRQMEIPGPPMPAFDDPDDEANFLERDDRIAVAAYVASVAGVRTEGPGRPDETDDPQAIFTASCGSCHIFEDAGTTGDVGPNLDESGVTLAQAIQQIRDGGGGMPPFGAQLSEEQIRALAEYVVESRAGR